MQKIMTGDFDALVGEQRNTSEKASGGFGLGQRNERGDINTQFPEKAGSTWTWRSPVGNTKNMIDYIMTDKPSMVTDVTDPQKVAPIVALEVEPLLRKMGKKREKIKITLKH